MKYLVKKWTNNYNRKQGISDVEQTNLSLKEALKLCKKIVDDGYAVVAEVLTIEDNQQCIVTYDQTDISNKLFLELCKECIEDLDSYNPYIHKDKTSVNRDEIITIQVEIKDCNNYEENLGIKNGVWIEI